MNTREEATPMDPKKGAYTGHTGLMFIASNMLELCGVVAR